MNDRPLGVTILAVLHMIGGFALLAAVFLLGGMLDAGAAQALQRIGASAALLKFSALFISVVGIGSGVGMWCGYTWGWWLAGLYYVQAILRNGFALMMVIWLADQFQGGQRGPAYYYAKHSGRIIIDGLILLYLFRWHIREYFNCTDVTPAKAISILLSACSSIAIIATLYDWLF